MSKGRLVILLAVFFSAFFLNTHNNDFKLGYHPDEPKKVRFIETNTQDFQHPILMLQVVRAVNYFAHFTDKQAIATLGRTVIAAFGAATAVLCYLLARAALRESSAYVVAALAATSPILTAHSHYLKEDIVLTFFCLLSLLLLFRYIRVMDSLSLVGLGVATGLALSSHYKGILLFVVYVLGPVFVPIKDRRRYFKGLITCATVAIFTFLVVNYPIFSHQKVFNRGISFDLRHIFRGHGSSVHAIKIYATSELFGFHLVNSIIPGITLVVALFALAFLVATLLRWKHSSWREKILIVYVLLFYLVVEVSPTKPFPDFMRYVIPVIPVLLYFSVRGVEMVVDCLQFVGAKRAFAALVAVAFSLPLYESIRLVGDLDEDTREKAERLIAENHWQTKSETYAALRADVWSLSTLNIQAERDNGVTHLVASSFMYDRFIHGKSLKNQGEAVYEAYQKYGELFSLPFTEITPPYKSFAFHNPTVRIIDIRGIE
jgi:hypothetical protein